MKVSIIKLLFFIILATLTKSEAIPVESGDILQLADTTGEKLIQTFDSKGLPFVIQSTKTKPTKDSFIQTCINFITTKNSKLVGGAINARKANDKYQSRETLDKIANVNEKSYKFGYHFRERIAKKFHKYFERSPKVVKRDGTSITMIESFNKALTPVEDGLMAVLDAILKNEHITNKMIKKLEEPGSYVGTLFKDPKKVVGILKDNKNLMALEGVLIKRRKYSFRAFYIHDSFSDTVGLFGIIILVLLFLPLFVGIGLSAAGILTYIGIPMIIFGFIIFLAMLSSTENFQVNWAVNQGMAQGW